MFHFFQLVILFISLALLVAKLRQKKWRIMFLVIAGFLSTLEIVSVYLIDSFINYQFYSHLNFNAIKWQGFQFVGQFLLFIGFFVFITFLLHFVSRRFQNTYFLNKNRVVVPVILASLFLLSVPEGILNKAYGVIEILNAEDKSLDQALEDVGIPPSEYVTPDQVIATKGKNIIVISIESLEQGLLGEEFDNVTPFLTHLSREWTFYDKMPVGPGGGWTSASMYNYQVGMPAFFKGKPNVNFQGVTDVKITGLGHILGKAGYMSRYLIGNPDFAGIRELLLAYKIPVISQKNCLGKYPKAGCGLHDYDLFEEAKKQLKKLNKNSEAPFALFMSTINTHFPNGIYDERMEAFVSKRDNSLEFAISAVDYLIKDFMGFLEKEKLLDNTVVFIFPDHTLMGTTGPVVERLKKEKRQIYLITNVDDKKMPKRTSDTLYQIDLPRMIIAGAEIKTNAKFLRDFIKTTDYIDFLNKNRIGLTTLNAAAVKTSDFKNGIKLNISRNRLFISSDEAGIRLKLHRKLKEETFDIAFNPEMSVVRDTRSELKKAFQVGWFDELHGGCLHLIVNLKAGKIDNAYFGNKRLVGIFKNSSAINFSKEEIALIAKSNNTMIEKMKNLSLEKPVKKFEPGEDVVLITSSESETMGSINSEIKINGKTFSLSRGLNIFYERDDGKFTVEGFDTYGNAHDVDIFIERISSLIKNKKFWAIASHDAVSNKYPGFKEALKKLNFKILPELNWRAAYIAYVDRHQNIKEFTAKTSLSHCISIFPETMVAKEGSNNL